MSFGRKGTSQPPIATPVKKETSVESSANALPPSASELTAGAGTAPQQTSAAGNAAEAIGDMQQKIADASEMPLMRFTDPRLETEDYKVGKWELVKKLIEKLDFAQIEQLPDEIKKEKIKSSAETLLPEISIPLNGEQHALLKEQILDEVLGFGPLEPLMRDPDVSDIMINTCEMTYIEKGGKLALSDISFASEQHLINVVQRIVSLVGRRVDESSPMVDARMPDGSRFNAIIPPLAIDGSLVSIRKFKKNKMPLSDYVKYESMTTEMYELLEIAGEIRMNILVSGGTGSGKTTLLNALSGHISPDERVITIEDAAELQLHQPHVLRLETRPANSEGVGEITQRALVKNALRMRPDRIILGEIRGEEVIDVLAAMNTGHEGSMATIHANNPRDCLSRLENLVGLSGIALPMSALRSQIASAIHVIVQLSRMRDGGRRITHIEEIVGMEGDVITTQQLFGYKPGPMGADGKLTGNYFYTGIKPRFFETASYFNLADKLENVLNRAKDYQQK